MKLRIKGNSIRLRLLRSEVEEFASSGRLTEEIKFGPNGSPSLRYTLTKSSLATEVSATFENNEISVAVPETLANAWMTSDVVGIDANGSDKLSIVIEKDFACLDRPDDPDREDAFPNPKAVCE